jgi:phenolic acid decarboxylase
MPHALVGKKTSYRHDNGWEYHALYENEEKIRYEVVRGPFDREKTTPDQTRHEGRAAAGLRAL